MANDQKHNVHGEGDAMHEGQFDIVSEAMPLGQLIGTDTCDYCDLETECLSIGEDAQACGSCLQAAFRQHWGAAQE